MEWEQLYRTEMFWENSNETAVKVRVQSDIANIIFK